MMSPVPDSRLVMRGIMATRSTWPVVSIDGMTCCVSDVSIELPATLSTVELTMSLIMNDCSFTALLLSGACAVSREATMRGTEVLMLMFIPISDTVSLTG